MTRKTMDLAYYFKCHLNQTQTKAGPFTKICSSRDFSAVIGRYHEANREHERHACAASDVYVVSALSFPFSFNRCAERYSQ